MLAVAVGERRSKRSYLRLRTTRNNEISLRSFTIFCKTDTDVCIFVGHRSIRKYLQHTYCNHIKMDLPPPPQKKTPPKNVISYFSWNISSQFQKTKELFLQLALSRLRILFLFLRKMAHSLSPHQRYCYGVMVWTILNRILCIELQQILCIVFPQMFI